MRKGKRFNLAMGGIFLAGLAGLLLATGGLRQTGGDTLQSAISPRLVSIEPLPEMDGATCEWVPASASPATMAAWRQEQRFMARAAVEVADADKLDEVKSRKPLRVVQDPYYAFSAVAVDPVRDEVVLTDENQFNILVYDRLDNTPPTARMTEPKRMIGGLATKIEFQCGLYIDPPTGDIYAVNNDTVDTLVIFNRQAKGDVKPTRELYTPHGTFGIAVDEDRKELFLTIQHDNSVVVYEKAAVNDRSPIRLLQGKNTQLADPHGIALDPKKNLMFVTNFGNVSTFSKDARDPDASGYGVGSGEGKQNWPLGQEYMIPGSGRFVPPAITVHRADAAGDTAPLRVIEGPKTQMNWPTGIAFHPDRNELYVANDMGHSILVFDANASGDAAPKRVLAGPQTLLSSPTGVTLDLKNKEVWAANFGNHTATVYPIDAGGDTAPLRVIRSAPLDAPVPGLGNPHPIAYDSKREEILVPN